MSAVELDSPGSGHDARRAVAHFDPDAASVRAARRFVAEVAELAGTRAADVEQVGDGAQSRGLACAIAAQNRGDLPFGQGQRHALEHQDDMVVDHLDAVDVENRFAAVHVLCSGMRGRSGAAPPQVSLW